MLLDAIFGVERAEAASAVAKASRSAAATVSAALGAISRFNGVCLYIHALEGRAESRNLAV